MRVAAGHVVVHGTLLASRGTENLRRQFQSPDIPPGTKIVRWVTPATHRTIAVLASTKKKSVNTRLVDRKRKHASTIPAKPSKQFLFYLHLKIAE